MWFSCSIDWTIIGYFLYFTIFRHFINYLNSWYFIRTIKSTYSFRKQYIFDCYYLFSSHLQGKYFRQSRKLHWLQMMLLMLLMLFFVYLSMQHLYSTNWEKLIEKPCLTRTVHCVSPLLYTYTNHTYKRGCLGFGA